MSEEFKTKKVSQKHLAFVTEKFVQQSTLEDLDNIASDSDKERKMAFTGTAYSGLPIMNHPFWGNLIFDVAQMKSKNKVPILINHDMSQPAGHGNLSFNDNRVTVNGVLYGELGKKYYDLMQKGFPMQESVYIEPESVEELKQGQFTTVNGQEVEGPMMIFRNGMIKEVSLTPLGADSNTETTAFNNPDSITIKQKDFEMSKEVKQEIKVVEETVEPTVADKQFGEFLTKLEESHEAAFAFACDCAKSEKTEDKDKEDEKFESLKKENEDLKAELKEIKEKAKAKKKEEKTSLIAETYKSFGLEACEVMTGILLEQEEEKFSAALEGLKKSLSAKSEVEAPAKELFEAKKVEEKPAKSQKELISEAAKQFMDKNPRLKFAEAYARAIKEVTEAK